jgi:hypothetical protein
MNIKEGNKLIAEFLGAEIKDNTYCFHLGNPAYQIQIEQMSFEDIGRLQYHTSWDWLMPVVEKIESIHNKHDGYYAVYIGSNSCTIQGTELHRALKDIEGYGAVYFDNVTNGTKIESTWQAVIHFIQWYKEAK